MTENVNEEDENGGKMGEKENLFDELFNSEKDVSDVLSQNKDKESSDDEAQKTAESSQELCSQRSAGDDEPQDVDFKKKPSNDPKSAESSAGSSSASDDEILKKKPSKSGSNEDPKSGSSDEDAGSHSSASDDEIRKKKSNKSGSNEDPKSGSSDDAGHCSSASDDGIQKKKPSSNKDQKSDSSDEGIRNSASDDDQQVDKIKRKKKRKNQSNFLDSSDEEKTPQKFAENSEDPKSPRSSSDDELHHVDLKKKKKLSKANFLDSSDEEKTVHEDQKSAESSDDSKSEPSAHLKKKKLKKLKKSNFSDSSDECKNKENAPGSSDEDVNHSEVKKSSRKKKKKDFSVLKTKKSFVEENLKDELSQQLFSDSADAEVPKKERKSKTNALEEIRSETQRMIRESRVALPYHKPKQRSLADFLNRRKNIAAVSLRTPIEHMSKVWKQIEEREKEAEHFYKSESEDETQEAQKTPEIAEEVAEIMQKTPEKPEVKPEPEISCGFTQNLSELDLHLTEEFSEPMKVPKLTGEPDEMIDLDIEKPKVGALGLLKRFMKHTSLQKPQKEETSFSVFSSELDEKGEIINIKEETVKVKSETPKPGESLVKLKATLQQQMATRREEQIAKRREEMKFYEDEILGEKETCEDEEEFEIEDSESSSDEEEEKEKNLLFDEAEESNNSDSVPIPDSTLVEENERLLNLCSGEFPSQPFDMRSLEKDEEQPDSDDGKNEALTFCSGVFPSQFDMRSLEKEDAVTSTTRDSDTDSDDGFGLTKKRCKKLIYDDEEEDAQENIEEDAQEGIEEDAQEDIEEDEQVDNEEDEHAEEDEVEDEETEQAKKLSRAFLDGEAELSGSEWGSEDEDEKDLDMFEQEEGDADQISQRKLQKELGRIHMREIMNDDKREVQLLQEILLEDGELHSDGPKRQRLFRWTNQEDGNLDQLPRNPFDDEEDFEDVPEDEELWRQQRVEREKFLKEKKIDNLIIEEQTVNVTKNFKPTTLKVANRGSFLSRSEKMLSKLANMTSSSSENPIANTRGRGMVFASVEPPKDLGAIKRKGDDLKSSDAKKAKTIQTVTNKLSIFDKLKMSE